MGGAHQLSPLKRDVPSVDPARYQAVVVCADATNPLRVVGGITLLERLLRQLSELRAVESIMVLKPGDFSLPAPSNRVRKVVTYQNASGSNAWEMLRDARSHLSEHVIAVGADLLIDQRLLEWLTQQNVDAALSSSANEAPEIAMCLRAESLDAPSLEAARISVTAIDSLPAYWESMHGEVPFHLRRIATERDVQEAWRILLDYIQRRTLELPASYFDPFFENLIVRRLASTAITANQVTLVTTVLGFAVAALYLTGWLRVGVLLAIFVEVLDGVDGKLARITRTTSKAGEYEHILDFFYENSWWLALGRFLSTSGSPSAWFAAWLMVAFDLTDNIVYSVADVRWGRSVDNASPLLSRFRLIAGRRNIYTWMLLPAIFLGAPALLFYVTVAWAGVTAAVHAAWGVGEAMRSTSRRPARETSVP